MKTKRLRQAVVLVRNVVLIAPDGKGVTKTETMECVIEWPEHDAGDSTYTYYSDWVVAQRGPATVLPTTPPDAEKPNP